MWTARMSKRKIFSPIRGVFKFEFLDIFSDFQHIRSVIFYIVWWSFVSQTSSNINGKTKRWIFSTMCPRQFTSRNSISKWKSKHGNVNFPLSRPVSVLPDSIRFASYTRTEVNELSRKLVSNEIHTSNRGERSIFKKVASRVERQKFRTRLRNRTRTRCDFIYSIIGAKRVPSTRVKTSFEGNSISAPIEILMESGGYRLTSNFHPTIVDGIFILISLRNNTVMIT